jgi:hypothetical protein
VVFGHLLADPVRERTLGLGAAPALEVSYNTAWLLKHKLMSYKGTSFGAQAMIERDSDLALSAIVQMDDTYRGGAHDGIKAAWRWFGSRQSGQDPVFWRRCNTCPRVTDRHAHECGAGVSYDCLTEWAQRHLVPGTAVVSRDELNCFPGATDADCTHTDIPIGGGMPDLGHPIFWWVNTLRGDINNALHGTVIYPSSAITSIVASTWPPRCHGLPALPCGRH